MFYSLTASHAPAITSQPTNQIVTAGQNATFTVGATGNGTLGYQWQFNATNVLAKATNVSLTITNAQSTSAGNYSVVVTDSIGSVTSVVATLTVAAGTPPTLGIMVSGINAIISWPSSTDPGFVLQIHHQFGIAKLVRYRRTGHQRQPVRRDQCHSAQCAILPPEKVRGMTAKPAAKNHL